MTNSTKMHGAVIGCGFVSRFHLDAWSGVPGARLVALCDRDRDRVDRAGARVPGARCYTDAAELFDREQGLDFVEICTPPESHRGLVELAARHKLHVLCQKPAALIRSDFESMIDDCTKAGVRLMIHENWRFRPWYRAMRAEISSGLIGQPIRLRIDHHDTRALRTDGFVQQPYLTTMPRLILMDMGCHLVDTSRYLMGEVRKVLATIGRYGERTVGEDLAMVTLYFEGGGLGSLDFSWCTAPDRSRPEWALNLTVAEGTAGTLRLLTDGSLELTSPSGRRERRPVSLPPAEQVYVQGYAATQQHFIDGLISGGEHETRAADNLKTMDAVWAAYRSAEEGRIVTV
ncbi:MAG: Gfo/Idh/MocA family protein [Isosphaeraceae bacterium]